MAHCYAFKFGLNRLRIDGDIRQKAAITAIMENMVIAMYRLRPIQLENVHWISIPGHIGDPIGVAYGGATWRVMFEKITGLLISVPPLARWRECVPIHVSPLLILWQRMTSEVDSWKTVNPSAKVTQEE